MVFVIPIQGFIRLVLYQTNGDVYDYSVIIFSVSASM